MTLDPRTIEAKTNEIAKWHGCDRGTFTVCWAERERGEQCRCKQEAIRALANETQSSDGGVEGHDHGKS